MSENSQRTPDNFQVSFFTVMQLFKESNRAIHPHYTAVTGRVRHSFPHVKLFFECRFLTMTALLV